MGTYEIITSISVVIIISYIFNVIAKRTNIPSVLMLIVLGVLIQLFISTSKTEVTQNIDFQHLLSLLGKVGLILIVLEAALDLKLKRENISTVVKAFAVALLSLLVSSGAIAGLFKMVVFPSYSVFQCFLYAVPLSILSSAIIIPSVTHLPHKKKEFMVYDGALSDILGIMLFNYLLKYQHADSWQSIAGGISLNLLFTIVVSLIAGFGLVWLFQKLRSQAKLFLIISVLLLLYVLGSFLEISSLIIILVFGLVLNNNKLFFEKRFKRFVDSDKLEPVMHEFHILTLESAFVTRTFFFVIFGITIELSSLFSFKVALNGIAIVAILVFLRWFFLKIILFRDIFPEIFIGPRGLITILLFYAIPNGLKEDKYDITADLTIPEFDLGILLYVILLTNGLMAVSLIKYRGERVSDALKSSLNIRKGEEDDEENPLLENENDDKPEN